MATKKTGSNTMHGAKLGPTQYTVQNCSVVNSSAANEHTRAAVEALAKAAQANAEAIKAIAESLKGSPANMTYGMHFGVKDGD